MKIFTIGSYREIDALIEEVCFKRCPYLGDTIDWTTVYYSTDISFAIQLLAKYSLTLTSEPLEHGFSWVVEGTEYNYPALGIAIEALRKKNVLVEYSTNFVS